MPFSIHKGMTSAGASKQTVQANPQQVRGIGRNDSLCMRSPSSRRTLILCDLTGTPVYCLSDNSVAIGHARHAAGMSERAQLRRVLNHAVQNTQGASAMCWIDVSTEDDTYVRWTPSLRVPIVCRAIGHEASTAIGKVNDHDLTLENRVRGLGAVFGVAVGKDPRAIWRYTHR